VYYTGAFTPPVSKPNRASIVMSNSLSSGWVKIDSIDNTANNRETDSVAFLNMENGLFYKDGADNNQVWQVSRVFYPKANFAGDSITLPINKMSAIKVFTKPIAGTSEHIVDTLQYFFNRHKQWFDR
jgi:hypothetical protein